MTAFEEDQREANRILREWITDKTGTTNIERGADYLIETFRQINEAAERSIYGFYRFIGEVTEAFEDVAEE